MNAPPGVDKDTSGEDFTPPPTPPPDRNRPQFSLTSLLTATPRPRRAQRQAAAKVKQQTPIEAADGSPPKQTTARLKKKVRIASTDQTQGADAGQEEPISIPALQAELDKDPTSESSRNIIELLNKLLTQNNQVDADDADSESSSPGSTVSYPDDAMTSPSGLADDSASMVESLALPDQATLPIKAKQRLRKRAPSKLLPSWLRAGKRPVSPTTSTQKDPPTPTAYLPVPLTETHNSESLSSAHEAKPFTAPLPTPADLLHYSHPHEPKSAEAVGTQYTHYPATNPYWSEYHPYNAAIYPDPPAAWQGMPNPPPWLWTGQHKALIAEADHTSRQGPQSSSTRLPAFPPFYPHPASLQLWNPWYSSHQNAGSTTNIDPHCSPYDGIQEPEHSPPDDRGLGRPIYPMNSNIGSANTSIRDAGGLGMISGSERPNDGHQPRTSPGPAKQPVFIDAGSIASSTKPLVTKTKEPDGTEHQRQSTLPHKSAITRIKNGASSIERKMWHKEHSKEKTGGSHAPCAPEDVRFSDIADGSEPRSSPGELLEPIAKSPLDKTVSGGSDGRHTEHGVSSRSVAAPTLSSKVQGVSVRAKEDDGGTRHQTTSPSSEGFSVGEYHGKPGVLRSRSKGEANPSWSECLLSMAVCISK